MLQFGGDVLREVPPRYWLATAVFALGALLAYLVGLVNRRLLRRAGVPATIEGTAFERMARELGTSTVSIVAQLSAYFVLAIAVVVALTVARIEYTAIFWSDLVQFVPKLFIAVLILIVGVVVGDKVELVVQEYLSEIKLPDVNVIPLLAKYSVFYVATLIALAQVGLQTLALVVLLGLYGLAVIVFSVVAFWDMLRSAAAGVYLLLDQPYGIGDEVRLGEERGIVQEVDLFVTHVESDEEEYIVPNSRVFKDGIVRVR
ncbi:mechanosensitive ion channel domain-containing protein [Halobium palmae]|uniref:Mechanosensitive ion channel domain-containing protein n=1 Tax=Halobium palmae TaxID=1776492 RepID=A0ABD5RYX9_9EURY